MQLISTLIELALIELYDRNVIDWLPDDAPDPAFRAECEIEQNPFTGDFYLLCAGVWCIVDNATLQVWHSSRIDTVEVA